MSHPAYSKFGIIAEKGNPTVSTWYSDLLVNAFTEAHPEQEKVEWVTSPVIVQPIELQGSISTVNPDLMLYFEWVNNTSKNQAAQLLKLCGDNFTILMELSAKMKKHHIGYSPSTQEEVNNILALSLEDRK